MKKLLIIVLCFTLSHPCFGAFGSASAWDVRTAGNGGADTNGGAFDAGVAAPGTDESTGAGTAMTIVSAGTTGTCTPACSSTTHGPGNFFHVASGCTVGWYEIISQAAGTVTFDKTTGAGTCVGVLGGSLVTYQQAVANEQANAVNGNSIWIQSGTYTQSSLATVNIRTQLIRGYSSVHGDLTINSPLSSNPVITTATNSVGLIQICQSSNIFTVMNVNFTNTAGTPSTGIDNSNVACNRTTVDIVRCLFTGFTDHIFITSSAGPTTLIVLFSEFGSSTSTGILNSSSGPASTFEGNYFHVGAHVGLNDNGAYFNIKNNIFSSNTTGASSSGLVINAVNNTFNGNSVDGFDVTNVNLTVFNHLNNIYYNNTVYGVNYSGTSIIPLTAYNAYGSNGTANYLGLSAGTGDQTGISNPFVNAGAGNFALSGSALKGAGMPGVMPGGLTTGYIDIGCCQSAASAAPPQSTVYGQ